jgi:hypothetical protein
VANTHETTRYQVYVKEGIRTANALGPNLSLASHSDLGTSTLQFLLPAVLLLRLACLNMNRSDTAMAYLNEIETTVEATEQWLVQLVWSCRRCFGGGGKRIEIDVGASTKEGARTRYFGLVGGGNLSISSSNLRSTCRT